MSKVKPTTKEQLVYFVMQNISLGSYDKRFLTNLQTIQLKDNKPVTSNQAELLDKIILRYAKQLRKKEIDATEMIKLPWGVEPIESLPEYTDAFCTIKDNVIEIRSPYKKEFIKEIKNTKMRLTWDKDTKIWSGPLSEIILKHFIDCLDRHYHIVRYCPETTKIINSLADYEDLEWNPTYKRINGNFLITSINTALDEAVKDIVLDASPATIARLASAGILIDDSVMTETFNQYSSDVEIAEILALAVNDRHIYQVNNLDKLVRHLKVIGCDYVVMNEVFKNSKSTSFYEELYELLNTHEIKYDTVTRKSTVEVDLSPYKYPVIINTALWGLSSTTSKLRAAKVVHLGNSKPIDIK